MAANPAIKAAAAHKVAPHHAAPAPAAPRRAPIEHYTGLMAAPLNELSQSEARVRDVTARRAQDAVAYNAYVLGQQAKLAGAAQASDQAAVRQIGGAQAMAAGANLGAMQRMIDTRKAQGFGGGVPAQQLAGLRDDSVRTNMLMAAGTRDAAEVAQQNQGKAGFLAAAAMAGHQAAVARIAGEGADQEAGIRREKVGLLGQREQMAADIQAAQEQAAADVQKAQIAAAAREADRASRESIAGMQIDARRQEGETEREFRARQNRADRKVRLRTSVTNAKALGYVDPKERQRRGHALGQVQAQRDQAVAYARRVAQTPTGSNPDNLRIALAANPALKNAPREVIDYALAAALGHRAGVTPRRKGAKSAARRYYELERRIKSGRS